VISGFRLEVAGNCALLGYQAARSANCLIDLCLKGLDLFNELRLKVHLRQLHEGIQGHIKILILKLSIPCISHQCTRLLH